MIVAPPPMRRTELPGAWTLPPLGTYTLPAGLPGWFAAAVTRFSERMRAAADSVLHPAAPGKEREAVLRLALGAAPTGAPAATRAEAYTLDLGEAGIELVAPTAAGLRHGLETLLQLAAAAGPAGTMVAQRIEDWPAFAVRGFMLDVSRCKVPRMSSIVRLFDLLAACKINHVQLYTEHTFAFTGHEIAWGDASPYTADDIRALVIAAADRGLELAPNFNSFGHWERWLRHPEYRHLAECPDGFTRRDGVVKPHGTTLKPGPEALRLLESLYAELLPLFPTARFNAGCDETWELGQGASKNRAAEVGVTRVWADFVQQLHHLAQRHGKRLHVWADMVRKHPDAVSDLPTSLVGLIWGYEAGHPFAEQLAAFTGTGRTAWVCPGTSTWSTLGGRLGNALANLEEAARAGAAGGAEGYLITDWGDGGHHQFPCISYPGLIAGAIQAWTGGTADLPLADLLNRLVFDDPSGGTGRAIVALGNLPDCFAHRPGNRSILADLFYAHADKLGAVAGAVTLAELAAAKEALRVLGHDLNRIHPRGPDADILRRELSLTQRWLKHAVKRAIAQHTGSTAQNGLRRRELIRMTAEFEELWLARNRPGGLHESSQRFRDLLASYPA